VRSTATKKLCRVLGGVALGLGAVVLALLIGEGVVRLFALDRPLLDRVAPRMIYETEVHKAVPDPRLLLQMRPGASASYEGPYGRFTVNVNSLGFRGPERSPDKAPGVFRILCIGGSNVYGAGLDDNETWPARLEERLDAGAPGRFEVWNLGVSGYNALNMIATARDALALYDPDLILFALSNTGPRFFLDGTEDLEWYYAEDETLWLDLIPPEMMLLPRVLPRGRELFLLNHVRLYRYLMLTRLGWSLEGDPGKQGLIHMHHPHTVEPTREFLATASRRVPIAIFLAPMVQTVDFRDFYQGLDLPVLCLDASGMPEEYRHWHPPAAVMGWYAERLVQMMGDAGLLPR